MQRFIIILLVLFIGQIAAEGAVSAQPERAVQPLGILPPNYECTMTVYGTKDPTPRYVPARVRAYVIWTDRPLTLEYYVSDELDGVRSYSVLSRESLDRVCQ